MVKFMAGFGLGAIAGFAAAVFLPGPDDFDEHGRIRGVNDQGKPPPRTPRRPDSTLR